MYRWQVWFEVWPHSTGRGQTVDQAAAGPRRQKYYVEAGDICGALKLALCIQEGIKANPAVWEAPIVGVNSVSELGASIASEPEIDMGQTAA